MKKTLSIAGCMAILFACNNNSSNNAANTGSSDHAAHTETNSSTQNQVNPVTTTMDKMMQAMHGINPTGNDVDFAAMMLEHHKGAVEMSQVEIGKGKNDELKAFAKKVIDDQNEEIGFMQAFISKHTKTKSSNSAGFQKALNGSMMAMMNSKTAIYNDIDKDFAAQMIPHHQSAVDMAKVYLKYGREAGLITLCQNIISSQEKEINWLKEWLHEKVK